MAGMSVASRILAVTPGVASGTPRVAPPGYRPAAPPPSWVNVPDSGDPRAKSAPPGYRPAPPPPGFSVPGEELVPVEEIGATGGVVEWVKAHPFITLAVAGGAGYLIWRALRSGDND